MGQVFHTEESNIFGAQPVLENLDFPIGYQINGTIPETAMSGTDTNYQYITSMTIPIPGTWVVSLSVTNTSTGNTIPSNAGLVVSLKKGAEGGPENELVAGCSWSRTFILPNGSGLREIGSMLGVYKNTSDVPVILYLNGVNTWNYPTATGPLSFGGIYSLTLL